MTICHHNWIVLLPALLAALFWPVGSSQAQSSTASGQDTAATPTEQPVSTPAPAAKDGPRTSKAFGTRLETEPPSYVRRLDQMGIPAFADLKGLDFGLEQRTRFEYRSDSRRPELIDDEQFLLRSRVYIGVREVLDPFRFAVEFQDARQFHSDYPDRDRDVDEADFLQAFVELHFANALGEDVPVAFRAGRMTLEYVDRRLVGRNRWRNTVNSFDGFRLRLGQPASDFQVDVFAVQPVQLLMVRPNRPDEERWFYGIVGAWRGWSDVATFEPYYLISDEDRKNRTQADREIHTLGMHVFGPIGDTPFDYDIDAAYQFGEDGTRRQRAFAASGELGYTFAHSWKPRLSIATLYASGDRNPNDDISERFDRLFEVTHPYSTTDLFSWQNVISPKLRLSARPTKKLSFDASYGAYWLASDSDAWVTPSLRDKSGRSGDFLGQELELRVRYLLDPQIELEAGYSHFLTGPFAHNLDAPGDLDMFYVQTTLHF